MEFSTNHFLGKKGSSVLIPSTFPVESKNPLEQDERMSFVFSTAITDAGSFYSFMGFTAAHKAVLGGKKANIITSTSGENRYLMEPEYYVLNARCIKEVNAKMQDPKGAICDDAFQTVINLVSGSVRNPRNPIPKLWRLFTNLAVNLDANRLFRRSNNAYQSIKEDGRYERSVARWWLEKC